MQTNKPKVIPELVVTACISGGLAIACPYHMGRNNRQNVDTSASLRCTSANPLWDKDVLSLINVVLALLVVIYRYECSLGNYLNVTDSWQFFWITIFRVYIVDSQCMHSTDLPNITQSESVFILAILTLCFSAIYFFAAVTLIAVVKNESIENVDVVTYIYIGTSVAALVVDLTVGAHFGMDLQHMKAPLPTPPTAPESYNGTDITDFGMLRVGAFILMSFSLKGYIAHAVNIVLLVVLAVYLVDNRSQAKEHEHSIHKLGALNGYDEPKPVRHEQPWQQQRNDIFPGYARSNINSVFNHDEVSPPPPHRPRENPLSDYSNTPYRSDSWLKSSMNSNAAMGSRPFSYLEEPKRPIPVKPPVSPSNGPHWRRDAWSGPHVPDPDYSPPHARRLKSALKPAY